MTNKSKYWIDEISARQYEITGPFLLLQNMKNT